MNRTSNNVTNALSDFLKGLRSECAIVGIEDGICPWLPLARLPQVAPDSPTIRAPGLVSTQCWLVEIPARPRGAVDLSPRPLHIDQAQLNRVSLHVSDIYTSSYTVNFKFRF